MSRSFPSSCRYGSLCLAVVAVSLAAYAQNPTANCSFQLFDLNPSNPANPAISAVSSVDKLGTTIGEAIPGHQPPPSLEGFIRYADGTVKYFSPPGAIRTWLNARNDQGVTVGFYSDAYNNYPGFILRGSTIQLLTAPPNARPTGINNSNTIAGQYLASNGLWRGFERSSDGSLLDLAYPQAIGTYPNAINDRGGIVGEYYDAQYVEHGFIYSSGKWSTINYNLGVGTALLGISNSGVVLGVSTSGWGDFLYKNDGFETLPAVPNSTGTTYNGLSPAGIFTGTATDSAGTHGFLATCQ